MEEVVQGTLLPSSGWTFGTFWLSTGRIQAGFELGNHLCLGKGEGANILLPPGKAGLHHAGRRNTLLCIWPGDLQAGRQDCSCLLWLP